MTHLFVTNDFPPKIGGIQTMLWELWRRLDPSSFVVLTTPHPDALAWDAEQAFRVVRTKEKVLLPTPGLTRRIDALATEIGADTVMLDPALPVGLVGPRLRNAPYGVVLHGAEVTVPGRLPGSSRLLRRVLRGAGLIVAAGGYPLAEAERAAGRALPSVLVPPGVDTDRFVPLTATERIAVRARLGLPTEGRLVVSVSRLVPRKGMDVLIRAAALLAPSRPDLIVAIAGGGRDHDRLERLIRATGAPVRLLGRVTHEDLPGLYGCG
ncbi:MAG: glycosyltransferase family 4 protein, partial [Acidimicrobiales bacterium]